MISATTALLAHDKICGYASCYVRRVAPVIVTIPDAIESIEDRLHKLSPTTSNNRNIVLIRQSINRQVHKVLELLHVDCKSTLYNHRQRAEKRDHFSSVINQWTSFVVYVNALVALLEDRDATMFASQTATKHEG